MVHGSGSTSGIAVRRMVTLQGVVGCTAACCHVTPCVYCKRIGNYQMHRPWSLTVLQTPPTTVILVGTTHMLAVYVCCSLLLLRGNPMLCWASMNIPHHLHKISQHHWGTYFKSKKLILHCRCVKADDYAPFNKNYILIKIICLNQGCRVRVDFWS